MTRKEQLIQSLRNAADFLEQQCVGEEFDNPYGGCSLWFMFTDKATLQRAIVGKGTLRKEATDERFTLRRTFGEKSFCDFDIMRNQLCTKRVTVETLPPEPEQTITIAAKPERTVERVEWDCPDSILKPNDDLDDAATTAQADADADDAAEQLEQEKMQKVLSAPDRFDPV